MGLSEEIEKLQALRNNGALSDQEFTRAKELLLAGVTPAAGSGQSEPVRTLAWSRQPEVGHVMTNSIGMKLAWIPPGKFLMGSPDNEEGRLNDEGPQHEVEITRGFYLGVFPVTQKEYQRVIKSNPSWFSSVGAGKHKLSGVDTREFPVEQVAWYDAVEFCRRLSEMDGKQYDLPTEAEWEYACRAGAKNHQAFYFGDTLTSRTNILQERMGIHCQANCDTTLHKTSKVGSYPANAFGLFDMHGNVWEWVKDCYDADFYKKSSKADPECTSGSNRVIRGGGWIDKAGKCRSASRFGLVPSHRGNNTGFRVALVMPGGP